MSDESSAEAAFTAFVLSHGRRLKQALIAAMGGETGQEATAEALAWAWEHWDELAEVTNVAGYVYRVGRTRGLPPVNPTVRLFADPAGVADPPWVEPRLEEALVALSEKQRTVVMLIHAFSWSYRETAELLEVSVGSVQRHMERAMRKLRRDLRVSADA